MEETELYSTVTKPNQKSDNKGNDENEDRGNWDSKMDYLLSMIGYAVGLGNVWRFPYLAFENGGGAFLIPYLIMLAFAGIPVFFMEVSLGQFSSLGPTSVWKFSPLFKGVGFCMVILSALVSIYYNVIVAYTLFYFFSSLTSVLPWANCNNWWNNKETCQESTNFDCVLNSISSPEAIEFINDPSNSFAGSGPIFSQVSGPDIRALSEILEIERSELNCNALQIKNKTSPSEEYWTNYALRLAPNMNPEYAGNVNIHLGLSLGLAWIVVFFTLIKGIKSSGKVVYFTAIFPYVVLLIFVINGLTLEGASLGVQFYIGSGSDWSKLTDGKVWKDAATQIFYSLATAWGGLISLSSYNKFNNNCFQDALTVCLVNCGTSIFAGFAIFPVLGHMAYKIGKSVNEVVTSGGFGLAFIAYPEAILQLPASPLWAIMFFLMLFTLGLDSQFTTLETLATAIIDSYPRQLRNRRWQIVFILSILLFFLGFSCVTKTGLYWMELLDQYAAGWGFIVIAILEVVAVMYIYGGNRFMADIEMMIGKRSWWFWIYWKVCWFYITPILLFTVLIWSFASFSTDFPGWANGIGWMMIIFSLGFIPMYSLLALANKKWNLKKALLPDPDWGPYLQQHRGERYADMAEPREAIEIAKERLEYSLVANER